MGLVLALLFVAAFLLALAFAAVLVLLAPGWLMPGALVVLEWASHEASMMHSY
jgi:hypothetical protein